LCRREIRELEVEGWKLSPKTRDNLLNLARLVISGALLGWILAQAGLKNLAETARNADFGPFALALFIAVLGIPLRAYRWQILLDAVGARVPFRRANYLYFVGAFFNVFLPTGFGGDVVRVLEIGEGATSQQATGTVLVDRLTGFIALFALALPALPFAFNLLPLTTVWFIALLAGGVMVGSILLFEGKLLRRLTARFPRRLSLAGDAWLAQTYDVITLCGGQAIAKALVISVIFNLSQIWSMVLVAQALHLSVPVWTFFLFLPIAIIGLLLPISISGFGVREGVFVALFGQVGLSEAQATALSLAFYTFELAPGVVGGVMYLAAGVVGLRKK